MDKPSNQNKYEIACDAYEASMRAAGWEIDEAPNYYEAHTLAVAAAVDAAEAAELKEQAPEPMGEPNERDLQLCNDLRCSGGPAYWPAIVAGYRVELEAKHAAKTEALPCYGESHKLAANQPETALNAKDKKGSVK